MESVNFLWQFKQTMDWSVTGLARAFPGKFGLKESKIVSIFTGKSANWIPDGLMQRVAPPCDTNLLAGLREVSTGTYGFGCGNGQFTLSQ